MSINTRTRDYVTSCGYDNDCYVCSPGSLMGCPLGCCGAVGSGRTTSVKEALEFRYHRLPEVLIKQYPLSAHTLRGPHYKVTPFPACYAKSSLNLVIEAVICS